jgi:hypothetical protein
MAYLEYIEVHFALAEKFCRSEPLYTISKKRNNRQTTIKLS